MEGRTRGGRKQPGKEREEEARGRKVWTVECGVEGGRGPRGLLMAGSKWEERDVAM